MRILALTMTLHMLAPTMAAAKVKTEEVKYKAGNSTMHGYLAYDDARKAKRPGVLVVHEWWGHNDYARKRARMLAELGYVALAVDMYGKGKTASHPSNAKKFMGEVMSNMDAAEARFRAAKEVLEQNKYTDKSDIAAIGYCFGGGIVLHMARAGVDLDGVASFHGSLGTKTPAEAGKVKAKVLVLHGEDDPFVPQDQLNAFKKEMHNAEVDLEFHTYPGAKHAFTNPAATKMGKKFDLPLAYNAKADKESWDELKTFLQKIFADK